jgi:hypothetical protein
VIFFCWIVDFFWLRLVRRFEPTIPRLQDQHVNHLAIATLRVTVLEIMVLCVRTKVNRYFVEKYIKSRLIGHIFQNWALLKSLCRPSVCPSVRLSVRLSVRPSVRLCAIFRPVQHLEGWNFAQKSVGVCVSIVRSGILDPWSRSPGIGS